MWRDSARFWLTHAAPINSQRYIYFIIRNENYSASQKHLLWRWSISSRLQFGLVAFGCFFFNFFLFAHFLWTSSSLCGCQLSSAISRSRLEMHATMVSAWVKWTVFVYYVLCIGGHIVCKTPRSKWVPAVALFHSRRCAFCVNIIIINKVINARAPVPVNVRWKDEQKQRARDRVRTHISRSTMLLWGLAEKKLSQFLFFFFCCFFRCFHWFCRYDFNKCNNKYNSRYRHA